MHSTLLFCHVPFNRDLGAAGRYARAERYDGVEWNLDGWRVMHPRAARAQMLQNFRAVATLSSLHAPYTDLEIAHPEAEHARAATEILKDYVDFTAELGAHHLNLHACSWAPGPTEWSRDNLLRSLEALLTRAAAQSVTLALENLRDGPMSEPDTLVAILGASGIGVTFDVGHANGSAWVRTGQGSAEDVLRALPTPIVAAHVYLVENGGAHQAPETAADLAGPLQVLRERDCDFWVLELHTVARLAQTRRVVDDYLAEASVPSVIRQ